MIKFFYRLIYALLAIYASATFAKDIYLRGNIGIAQTNKIKNSQTFYQESGEKRFRNGFVSSVGIGYRINQRLRTELDYNRVDNLKYSSTALVNASTATYKQKLKLQSAMLNFHYDILRYKILIPYLGIGLGYSNIAAGKAIRFNKTTNITKSYDSKNTNNFSYSLIVGFAININKKFDIDISYRFQDFGKANGFNSMAINNNTNTISDVKSGSRIKIHNILAGIRYNF